VSQVRPRPGAGVNISTGRFPRLKELSDELAELVEHAAPAAFCVVIEQNKRVQKGSGFSIGRGLGVTNAHVVWGADRFYALYHDYSVEEARVLVSDLYRDLALVELKGVPGQLRLGDSDSLRLGELVAALGWPEYHGLSVSLGVVRGLDASVVNPAAGLGRSGLVRLQMDVAEGNSGGPVLNVEGEAVGVVKAVAGGDAIAIPSNTVKAFLKMIAKFGKPVVGYVGVHGEPLNILDARARGLGEPGLLVVGVDPGSPAARAGLRPGDVILRAGGRQAFSEWRLTTVLDDYLDKGQVELEVWRSGRKLSITTQVEARDAPEILV